MTITTFPENIDFVRWAAQLTVDFPNLQTDIPEHVSEWRDWANKLIYFNKLTVPWPTEDVYKTDESWKDWAKQFINSYNANN